MEETMSVHKERIRAWVEDLRTTDAPQGKGQLVTPEGGMCCLARACEVYRQQVGGEWSESGSDFHDARGCSSMTALPYGVQAWFGFEHGNPSLVDAFGVLSSAQRMNDRDGYTFAMIADAVERTFLSDN